MILELRELKHFSKQSLRNDRKTAAGMALSYPAAWLMMKAVPDYFAGALIWQKKLTPAEIFFSRNENFWLFRGIWEIFTFCMLIPMACGIVGWFSEKNGFRRKRKEKLYKILWFFGKVEIIRFLALLPVMAGIFLTGKIFSRAALAEEAGIWIFWLIQSAVLTFWAGIGYIRFCIGLNALPVIFLNDAKIGAWKAVRLSEKMLAGHYRKLFLIFLMGGTPTGIIGMTTVFFQIRIREYLQERKQNAKFFRKRLDFSERIC